MVKRDRIHQRSGVKPFRMYRWFRSFTRLENFAGKKCGATSDVCVALADTSLADMHGVARPTMDCQTNIFCPELTEEVPHEKGNAPLPVVNPGLP